MHEASWRNFQPWLAARASFLIWNSPFNSRPYIIEAWEEGTVTSIIAENEALRGVISAFGRRMRNMQSESLHLVSHLTQKLIRVAAHGPPCGRQDEGGHSGPGYPRGQMMPLFFFQLIL